MALYTIADLHLSFSASKPMDVFAGWENYVARLEENWRARVGPEDTIVLAGDLSWAMKLEDSLPDFSFLHSLPGKKIIMKGNHDFWWSTKTKLEAFFSQHGFDDFRVLHNCAYLEEGIAVCGTRGWLYNSAGEEDRKIVNREVGRLSASIQAAKGLRGKLVAFLHYPPVYDNMECREILELLQAQGIEDCYFGHIHGRQAAKKAPVGEYKGIRMHLVSCDYVGFCPVPVAWG